MGVNVGVFVVDTDGTLTVVGRKVGRRVGVSVGASVG